MPGPGAYTGASPERHRAQSAQQQPVAPFMSTNVRFMDNQQTSMLPGPGAYKQPTLSKRISPVTL